MAESSEPFLWLRERHTDGDQYLHGVSRILAQTRTAWQEMLIVETPVYGKGLILDGRWQSSLGDEYLYHEALVHPALICHGSPRRVLVLGGAEGASVREVLRWTTVEQVVMVDIDAEVVQQCRQYLPEMHQGAFANPRTEVVTVDAQEYLSNTTTEWDVIIADLTDPVESGPAFPLFTQEFYQRVFQVLSPQGYFVLQAGSVAPPEIDMHARTLKTLGSVFAHVLSYVTWAPTYGVPLGLALASPQPIPTRPDPVQVDQMLATQTQGTLRFIDGVTLLGLLQTPKPIRTALAAEDSIYTLAAPPQIAPG